MPGSGTFTSTQVSDVVIAVETGGLTVAAIKVFFDGADVSSLLSTLAPGTLAAGGITRRLRNFPAALPAVSLVGLHVVGVEVTFAGGVVARGHALWNVVPDDRSLSQRVAEPGLPRQGPPPSATEGGIIAGR
jgi:hypothetical protein